MPYSLNYAPVPLPPRRPESFGYGQEDMNALAQLIQGPTREEKMRALMAQFKASPYGQPGDPRGAYFNYNMNAMRRGIMDLFNADDFRAAMFPYLKDMGLAVGEYKKRP